MRPVRPGYYVSDLAGLQRLRRRVSLDEVQALSWRRDMLKRIDEVIRRVNKVIDGTSTPSASSRKRAGKQTKEAARASGG